MLIIKYNLPEGSQVDENTIKAFSEEAHKLGLLPKQAEGIINYYNKIGELQTLQISKIRNI